jgi:hypothetical protein
MGRNASISFMSRPVSNKDVIKVVKLDRLRRALKHAQDDLRDLQLKAQLASQNHHWSIARLKHLIERLTQAIESLEQMRDHDPERVVELAYLRFLNEQYANAYLCYFTTGELDYLCYFPVTE